MAVCINLTSAQKNLIEGIIGDLSSEYNSVETADFIDACETAVADLPSGLRSQLRKFRNMELGSAALLISGFEIDHERIGPSPNNWNAPWSQTPYFREEVFQCLLMSAVGHIFSYRTLEQGRFLRHVTPDHEKMADQVAGSSSVTLEWHTEEAFHPARGDFQSLMCYRNKEKAETNLAEVGDLDLETEVWEILRENRFYIRPDQAHQPGEYSDGSEDEVFNNVVSLIDNPAPRPLVTGPRHCPLLVVDQAFMQPEHGDAEASEALKKLLHALDGANQRIVLKPGQVLLFDNQRAPHGRSAFTPCWGPEKRWLRVLYGTADLRKSIGYRHDKHSRCVA